MTEQQQHPISPPKELVEQWCRNWTHAHGEFGVYLATQAARWGADQELEEILLYPGEEPEDRRYFDSVPAANIRAWRRPKPPSLAEQAIAELQSHRTELRSLGKVLYFPAINAALERLQELEKGNE